MLYLVKYYRLDNDQINFDMPIYKTMAFVWSASFYNVKPYLNIIHFGKKYYRKNSMYFFVCAAIALDLEPYSFGSAHFTLK